MTTSEKKTAVDLTLGILDLEQEIESVRDRVRDIEWRLDRNFQDVSNDARQRALDKLRFLTRELAAMKKELILCKHNQAPK